MSGYLALKSNDGSGVEAGTALCLHSRRLGLRASKQHNSGERVSRRKRGDLRRSIDKMNRIYRMESEGDLCPGHPVHRVYPQVA
jgi:hypothetical protein